MFFFFRETVLRTEFYVRFTNLIIARPTGDCNVRFAIRSLTRSFLHFTSLVRTCGFFNIEEHKPPRGGKRKMRVLSLTLEQRGYYRSMFLLLLSFFSFLSHSSIYPVCPHSFRVRTHQTYTVLSRETSFDSPRNFLPSILLRVNYRFDSTSCDFWNLLRPPGL